LQRLAAPRKTGMHLLKKGGAMKIKNGRTRPGMEGASRKQRKK